MCKCMVCDKEIRTQKEYFEICYKAIIKGSSHMLHKKLMYELNMVRTYAKYNKI
jgi:hypothetical protein